jgi:hypothetical protein
MTEQTWRADSALKGMVRGRQMRGRVRGRHDRADMQAESSLKGIVRGRQK